MVQARTALLGSTRDTSTRNSLRVTARHGESARGDETPWPIPARFASTAHLGGRGVAEEAWSARSVPEERTASQRMRGTASAVLHPSTRSLGETTRGEPWNSRAASYETEYASGFCDARAQSAFVTRRPDFLHRSLRAFEDPISFPTDSHVHRLPRPSSPTQPLIERATNERVSDIALTSMQRPVHRKTYVDLAQYPISARPSPYSFDLREHIERMRPVPLFKDRNPSGERISELRLVRPAPDPTADEISLARTAFNANQQRFAATARF